VSVGERARLCLSTREAPETKSPVALSDSPVQGTAVKLLLRSACREVAMPTETRAASVAADGTDEAGAVGLTPHAWAASCLI
jgi:hypothetical protein